MKKYLNNTASKTFESTQLHGAYPLCVCVYFVSVKPEMCLSADVSQ